MGKIYPCNYRTCLSFPQTGKQGCVRSASTYFSYCIELDHAVQYHLNWFINNKRALTSPAVQFLEERQKVYFI